MQQLLACHATMRQQQQRIDDLKKELMHTTIRHQQRTDDLKEEVSQCRKREEAGQEMFLQQFRKTRSSMQSVVALTQKRTISRGCSRL